MLIDFAGQDAYRGVQRVQGQAIGGVGVLIDHQGDDRYRAALWSRGVADRRDSDCWRTRRAAITTSPAASSLPASAGRRAWGSGPAAPCAPRDAEFQRKTALNEFGRELFAHTSAVYVNLASRGVFDGTAAKSLLEEMKTSHDFIREHATFANDQERDGVLRVYDEGIRQMQRRIDAASKIAR